MNPKTEQILETVRELREARAKVLSNNIQIDVSKTDGGFIFSFSGSYESMEFFKLAANKIDPICEALEVCVESLNKIANTKYADYTDAEDICKQGLIDAAEILGRDKG